MKEIYPFNMKPLMIIHCACGCEDYIRIDKYEDVDDEPEYTFKFVNPHFYTLKERISFVFARKEKYTPFGIIVNRSQYDDIISTIEEDVGPVPEFTPKLEYSEKWDCWKTEVTRNGDDQVLYGALHLDSIWGKIESPDDRQEIDIYPGLESIYKPCISTILSPTFEAECEMLFEKQQLIEFAQTIKHYRKS